MGLHMNMKFQFSQINLWKVHCYGVYCLLKVSKPPTCFQSEYKIYIAC